MSNTNQLPFGLAIASRIASEAISKKVAPMKVIIGNLIFLQKDDVFPNLLSIDFFKKSKRALTNHENLMADALIEELKSNPQYKNYQQRQELFEQLFVHGWKDKSAHSKAAGYMAFTSPKAKAVKNRSRT